MFHTREALSLRRLVAFELVRDEYPRHIRQPLQQLAEKLLCRLLITTALDENIQDVAILIDRSPQIMPLPLDRQEDLVQMPLVARAGTPATQLIGIGLAELPAPLADGLVGHDHATDEQKFFHIAVAETEAKVEPDTK